TTLPYKANGALNLAEHPNRRSSSTPLLNELYILDSDDIPVVSIACNQRLRFRLSIDQSKYRPGLRFAVFITRSGQRCVMFHSLVHSDLTVSSPAHYIVDCDTGNIPLLPGVYDIDVAVG